MFCGLDEELIKEGVSLVVNSVVDKSMMDLNYIRLDGLNTNFDEILNASKQCPLWEKKVVLIYRAEFLKDKTDSSLTKLYKEIEKYLKDLPLHYFNYVSFIQ